MIKFNEFVNEYNNVIKGKVEDFFKEIEDTVIKDFKMNRQQAKVFIKQYKDMLENDWKIGFTAREAIASTKRYGTKEK